MAQNNDTHDDYFIGDFTLSEMNSAAEAIIRRQNMEKKKIIARTAVYILLILLTVIMGILFLKLFPEIVSENITATHTHRSYDLEGTAGIIQDFLKIPIFLLVILLLIAEIIHENKRMELYSQYKVYKGVIGKICHSTEFKKPVFCVEVQFPDNTDVVFNYLSDDREAPLICETEIILIDFIRVKKNIVNPSVNNRNVRRKRYASNKIGNNKYIILRPGSQSHNF
ncbi:MAG: hypothetical protein ACI4J0_10260 [Huintestinicola sp.]|uniref:hypothetical protein n=1 Tax=Huintestinicola sp. TaxID=2981661 RepID=UPI003EFE8FB2